MNEILPSQISWDEAMAPWVSEASAEKLRQAADRALARRSTTAPVYNMNTEQRKNWSAKFAKAPEKKTWRWIKRNK